MLAALHAAGEKKAHDLVALDLREVASFTDFFLIASGTNTRQVQAIADEVVRSSCGSVGVEARARRGLQRRPSGCCSTTATSSSTSSRRRRGASTTSNDCGATRRASRCRRRGSPPTCARAATRGRLFEKRAVIELVARSEAMREALRLAGRVAATDANVLVTGESGAGKDALALFVHATVDARGGAVRQDRLRGAARRSCWRRSCSATSAARSPARPRPSPAGSKRRTGHARPRRDRAPLADAQAKLLRVIERREFERLGGRRTVRVDARLVALTNVDLDDAVQAAGVPRRPLLPPERRPHPRAAAARAARGRGAAGREVPRRRTPPSTGGARAGSTAEALARARRLRVPRQRARAGERRRARGHRRRGRARRRRRTCPSPCGRRRARFARATRRPTLAEVEAEYIRETLAAAGGNKSEAARVLGISRKNLYERLARVAKEVKARSRIKENADADETSH